LLGAVFGSFAGFLDAVGFAVHEALSGDAHAAPRPADEPRPIIEAMCWAHARRKFFDLARLSKAPIAIEAIERIDALFAIERDVKANLPPHPNESTA
jgi:hypothetical protein